MEGGHGESRGEGGRRGGGLDPNPIPPSPQPELPGFRVATSGQPPCQANGLRASQGVEHAVEVAGPGPASTCIDAHHTEPGQFRWVRADVPSRPAPPPFPPSTPPAPTWPHASPPCSRSPSWPSSRSPWTSTARSRPRSCATTSTTWPRTSSRAGGTNSPGYRAAAVYAATQFRAAGLETIVEDEEGRPGYWQTFAVPAAPLSGQAHAPAAGEEGWSCNVIGFVPGTDPDLSTEFVVVTAHLEPPRDPGRRDPQRGGTTTRPEARPSWRSPRRSRRLRGGGRSCSSCSGPRRSGSWGRSTSWPATCCRPSSSP